MKYGRFNVLMGGQAGSEAKGKMSAYLMDKFQIRIIMGNLSPNAGHTAIKDNVKVVTHHVPAGIVGNPKAEVIIGPAAVINVERLQDELTMLEEKIGFKRSQLFLSGNASVITQQNVRDEEATMTKIGSTAQGVGEARADRIMRRGILTKNIKELEDLMPMFNISQKLIEIMDSGGTILCEMGQGFDLCLFHGVDPVYCTSRIINPCMALAEFGIPAKYLGDVYAVIRPYPIRVNNRDGSSGPYPSKEITWEEVRRRCNAPEDITEITTTTKLKRRVFEFSTNQILKMVDMCRPNYLCLQFVNYIDWNIYGKSSKFDICREVEEFVEKVEEQTGIIVAYLGTGPSHEQMIDMEVDGLI